MHNHRFVFNHGNINRVASAQAIILQGMFKECSRNFKGLIKNHQKVWNKRKIKLEVKMLRRDGMASINVLIRNAGRSKFKIKIFN